MAETEQFDVIVIGAGIAGLTAAQILSREGLKTVVLEARSRNGGRIHTLRLPHSSGQGQIALELGASYLHGCVNSQDIQPLFTLANRLRVPTVTAAGDVLGPHRGWECPEVAIWRDIFDQGKEIDVKEIAELSMLFDRFLVYTLSSHKHADPNRKSFSNILESSLEACVRLLHEAGRRPTPSLSAKERAIFDTLFARYVAYVNPASRLPSRLSLGSIFEEEAAAGRAFNPSYPTDLAKSDYLDWLEAKRKLLVASSSSEQAGGRVVSKPDHRWEDRLVLGGFDVMIDFLARDLDIRHERVVRRVDWTSVANATFDSRNSNNNRRSSINGLIRVETQSYSDESKRAAKHFTGRFCLVCVPVGVLKSLDRRSSIVFHPPLPADKRAAIDRLGIPRSGSATHNKVVLQFAPSDIFWDREAAQIMSPGAKLHLLNGDFYGQSGVLIAHVWGGSDLPFTGRTDVEVVESLLDLLAVAYPSKCPLPRPIFTHVTRWSDDPFALGSYTQGEVGSSDADRHAYASSLPCQDDPRLLFAGEGTVDSNGGQQCTHGAFLSGASRAIDILDALLGHRCRLHNVRIVDYLINPRAPAHGMRRRRTGGVGGSVDDFSDTYSKQSRKIQMSSADHVVVNQSSTLDQSLLSASITTSPMCSSPSLTSDTRSSSRPDSFFLSTATSESHDTAAQEDHVPFLNDDSDSVDASVPTCFLPRPSSNSTPSQPTRNESKFTDGYSNVSDLSENDAEPRSKQLNQTLATLIPAFVTPIPNQPSINHDQGNVNQCLVVVDYSI